MKAPFKAFNQAVSQNLTKLLQTLPQENLHKKCVRKRQSDIVTFIMLDMAFGALKSWFELKKRFCLQVSTASTSLSCTLSVTSQALFPWILLHRIQDGVIEYCAASCNFIHILPRLRKKALNFCKALIGTHSSSYIINSSQGLQI